MKWASLIGCLGALALFPGAGGAAQLAFPDAVGHGRFATGGRGGAVHLVTTLADSGPGSLRACAEAAGPRTCVFRVSGTIRTDRPIRVVNPNITIAGQTSPGGVQLVIHPDASDGRIPLYFANTAHVIVRHLRFRPGFDPNDPDYVRASNNGIGFERTHDWIVDHISTAYTADQSMHCFQGARRWTVSNSLFALALSPQSHHYGPLLCGDQHRDQVGPGTYVGNLTDSMIRRTPNVKTTGCDYGAIDIVNNFNSNPGEHGISLWDDHPGTDGWGTCANIVNNVARKGAMTKRSAGVVTDGDLEPGVRNRWYAAGNQGINMPLYMSNVTSRPVVSPGPTSASPVAPLSVLPYPTSDVMARVLAAAGAWPRDELDRRQVDQARNGTGPARPPESSLGSFLPVLTGPSAPADADQDGMPDNWELARGLSPTNPADRNGVGPGGFTWLELWLDERHRQVMGIPPV